MEYPVRTKRWTRPEYDRLVAVGVFPPGEPVELLGGELVVAEPQSEAHYTAISLVAAALGGAFGPGWVVRAQGPIALDDESEPEPDVAVAVGTVRDYSRTHPARPVLVVEVADSSLLLDRRYKGSLYARARLEDYWIVNLVERVLEVYREPVAGVEAAFGWRYAARQVLAAADVVTPLAAPGVRLRISDLLP
jgi:Uma2 family endonuclease